MVVLAAKATAFVVVGPGHLPVYSLVATRVGSAILILLLVAVVVAALVTRFRRR